MIKPSSYFVYCSIVRKLNFKRIKNILTSTLIKFENRALF